MFECCSFGECSFFEKLKWLFNFVWSNLVFVGSTLGETRMIVCSSVLLHII